MMDFKEFAKDCPLRMFRLFCFVWCFWCSEKKCEHYKTMKNLLLLLTAALVFPLHVAGEEVASGTIVPGYGCGVEIRLSKENLQKLSTDEMANIVTFYWLTKMVGTNPEACDTILMLLEKLVPESVIHRKDKASITLRESGTSEER